MRQIKKSAEHGFSLIELMIVLVITGILLALAIPFYKDYSIKVMVTDAQQTALALTVDADSYYDENGFYPGTTAAERVKTTVSGNDAFDGRWYWSNDSVATLTNGDSMPIGQVGHVYVTFKADAFEGVTDEVRMSFEAIRDSRGNSTGWTCVYHSNSAFRLDTLHLPEDCDNLMSFDS